MLVRRGNLKTKQEFLTELDHLADETRQPWNTKNITKKHVGERIKKCIELAQLYKPLCPKTYIITKFQIIQLKYLKGELKECHQRLKNMLKKKSSGSHKQYFESDEVRELVVRTCWFLTSPELNEVSAEDRLDIMLNCVNMAKKCTKETYLTFVDRLIELQLELGNMKDYEDWLRVGAKYSEQYGIVNFNFYFKYCNEYLRSVDDRSRSGTFFQNDEKRRYS
eukprot:UN30620